MILFRHGGKCRVLLFRNQYPGLLSEDGKAAGKRSYLGCGFVDALSEDCTARCFYSAVAESAIAHIEKLGHEYTGNPIR